MADRSPSPAAELDGFDYVWLLSWLGLGGEPGPASMTQVPFLLQRSQRRIGTFAARSPRRVNPIGLSLVQVLDVSGPELRFAGVDLVDGTPIVDIKPYVSAFDRPPGEPRSGWFDTIAPQQGATPSTLAEKSD